MWSLYYIYIFHFHQNFRSNPCRRTYSQQVCLDLW